MVVLVVVAAVAVAIAVAIAVPQAVGYLLHLRDFVQHKED